MFCVSKMNFYNPSVQYFSLIIAIFAQERKKNAPANLQSLDDSRIHNFPQFENILDTEFFKNFRFRAAHS